jgi:hypothetical protein
MGVGSIRPYIREMSMRGLTFAFFVVSFGLVAFGCKSDDAGVLAAEARWQLRCPTPSGGCLSPRPARAVSAREGDPDAIVACGFTNVGGGQRALSIELVESTGATLEIDNILVNQAGGVIAADGCQVMISENGITFGPHHCGPEAPSPSQPCQLTTLGLQASGASLVLDDGTVEGSLLTTTLRCVDIQDEGAAETRQLVSPDSPVNLMPAPIAIANCDGF